MSIIDNGRHSAAYESSNPARLDQLMDATRSCFSQIHMMGQIARERDQLRAMSTRELKDIGLTRLDAMQEIRQPRWRFPFWRRVK